MFIFICVNCIYTAWGNICRHYVFAMAASLTAIESQCQRQRQLQPQRSFSLPLPTLRVKFLRPLDKPCYPPLTIGLRNGTACLRTQRLRGYSGRVCNTIEVAPIPRSIHDIPNGDHILGFGANLAEDHPGYHDEEYKRRRSWIADLAKKHKVGEPIPNVQYTIEEARVWEQVLTKLSDLYPTHACREYLELYPLFNFSPGRIPQLEELSQVLEQHTGWKIRPVAGLLHPRQFLNGLAFKTFHSTQYIRHPTNPMYTPEPDICHEILGHIPLLAHPDFADLAEVIGLASLGASDKEIWHLTKLYWYTVEFGTIQEDDGVKAFGAGLLSSFGELQHMKSGKPAFQELDPFAKLPKMSYKDGFQNMYFLCHSFSDVAAKIHSYTEIIQSAKQQNCNFV